MLACSLLKSEFDLHESVFVPVEQEHVVLAKLLFSHGAIEARVYTQL